MRFSLTGLAIRRGETIRFDVRNSGKAMHEILEMPAMTMVFQVPDWSVLDHMKAGDKIRFRAERIGGAYTVTALEAAK